MKNKETLRHYGREPKTINDRIEYLRKTFNYSVAGFSKKIGGSKSAMINVLSDTKSDHPTFRMIKSICKIFPVNEEWLLVGTGDPFTIDDIEPYVYSERIVEPTIDPEVSDRMKLLRMQLGLTQSIFADTVGSTRDVISFIESNRSAMAIPMLKRVIEKHRVNPYWILFGIGNMYVKKQLAA